jgi:flagellar motor switch protein FliN/FliY
MNKTPVHPIAPDAAPASAPVGAPLVAKDMTLVGHVPVSLTVLVGTVSLSIEELFALRAGQVLTMNESLDAPVTLQLNGKPVARGELVAVEDHIGIRITELS